MVSGTARSGPVGVRRLRMYLRPLRHSDQHDLLLALVQKGNAVLYACPESTEPDELNDAYDKAEGPARSTLLTPCAIGPLDGGDHYVSFLVGASEAYVCSEPRIVKRDERREALNGAPSQREPVPRGCQRVGVLHRVEPRPSGAICR